MNEQMEQCIQHCLDCHIVCTQTIPYCLQMGGAHSESDHIRLMLDCVQICQASADFMLRESPRHVLVCAACAVICARCAEACARFEDERMDECAEVCRQCAESCQEMAAVAA